MSDLSPFDEYLMTNRTGVLIHWERYNTQGVQSYNILRAERRDGDYTVIANARWPADSYIDPNGHPSCYYKVQEIDELGEAIYTSAPFIGEEMLIKASLYYTVKDFLRVPVYEEELMFRRGRKEGHVAFKNWNYDPKPEVRITSASGDGAGADTVVLSEDEPIYATVDPPNNPPNGYKGNYPNGLKYRVDYRGNVYFVDANNQPVAVHEYDTVYVTYYVRMFSGSEMNNALAMALSGICAQPGAPKFTHVVEAPHYWDLGLVMGATFFLLNSLLIGLNQREKRLLLTDPDNNDIIANLKDLAKNAEDTYKDQQKALPISVYPKIGSLVTPEYYFPGGRARMFRYMFKGGAM